MHDMLRATFHAKAARRARRRYGQHALPWGLSLVAHGGLAVWLGLAQGPRVQDDIVPTRVKPSSAEPLMHLAMNAPLEIDFVEFPFAPPTGKATQAKPNAVRKGALSSPAPIAPTRPHALPTTSLTNATSRNGLRMRASATATFDPWDTARNATQLNSIARGSSAPPEMGTSTHGMPRDTFSDGGRARMDEDAGYPSSVGEYRNYGVFSARLRPDGTMDLQDGGNLRAHASGATMKASFDIGDAILRAAGYDPYQLRKLDVLDKTRPQREAIARAYSAQQAATAGVDIEAWLTSIWHATSLTPAERRRAILQLWDTCLEDGDATQQQAGERARAAIVAFIQRHAEPTPNGFSRDELDAFNQLRRSRQALIVALPAPP